MNPKRLVIALLLLCFVSSATLAQDEKKPSKEAPEPRAKDGKKLLSAMDLMKIANVGAPRISPDGTRIVYAVSETERRKTRSGRTSANSGSPRWPAESHVNTRAAKRTRPLPSGRQTAP